MRGWDTWKTEIQKEFTPAERARLADGGHPKRKYAVMEQVIHVRISDVGMTGVETGRARHDIRSRL